MAKHKKPAPAAKKPAAKPTAAGKKKTSSVPAKKSSPPSTSKKSPTKPAPAKAHAAKPEPHRSGKSTPPIPPTAKSKPPLSTKTTPPISSKTNPPTPPKATATKAVAPAKPSSPIKAAPPAKPAPAPKAATVSPAPTPKAKAAKPDARELLRNRILGAKKASKPIAFTLEEVREIAKTLPAPAPVVADPLRLPKPATPKPVAPKPDLSKLEKPAAPSHIKAASLADILGFNPKKAQKAVVDIDPESVPEKFRRYYRLLLDLRAHITEGLNLHTEETLKRSAKDDAGDLSSYGQHMADSGTDTFDRDFALSLVSSEQEALTEIEAAIKRIHDGSYGICEVTSKPIAKDRLLAVPFTRYSAEAQKEIEKNRMRTRTAAGLFGEMGEDGAKITDDDGGGDE
jgi:RNA polymerase-binding transcription factor DksA